VLAGTAVAPGQRQMVQIPVAEQYIGGTVFLPAMALCGVKPGPSLFVCAAIHGDEIVGVEIIRRLLLLKSLARLRGTLIAVPVVNVYGFHAQSRYLPDRRDLNRSFPGSPTGSLAARLAHTFMREVVANATHGIDIHSAARHRTNLPQMRISLDAPDAERLARAFGAPVVLDAALRDGSLRHAAQERGVTTLLYEAGEALRFDEIAVRAGVRGIASVMRALEMLPPSRGHLPVFEPTLARSSRWVRAPQGGLLRSSRPLGSRVRVGDTLGFISDPIGQCETCVRSPLAGVLIGRTELPLVNEGDAMYHIASVERAREAIERIEEFQSLHDPDGDTESLSGEPPIL